MKENRISTNRKFALALGGGGARGLAHIGVLKVLEREKIPIALITGTSIGAVIGGIYAQSPNSQLVELKFREFLASPVYRRSGLGFFRRPRAAENLFAQVATHVRERVVISLARTRQSIMSSRRLRRALDFLLDEEGIENTKIPFAAVAVDLYSGEEIVLQNGDMKTAIAASASIPGFLPPISYDSSLLVDGAVIAPVPVTAAFELGAEMVIAVDVSPELEPQPELENVIDIVFRTGMITAQKYRMLLVQKAHVVIRPQVGQVHWSEFELIDTLIAEGVRAAERALPQIQAICQ